MPRLDPAAPTRRKADPSRSDPAEVARLVVQVREPDGTVVYETWQEAETAWANCFLRFGEREHDTLGQPIDSSYWDVADPVKTLRENLKLRCIVAQLGRGWLSVDVAARGIRNRCGEDHVAIFLEALRGP